MNEAQNPIRAYRLAAGLNVRQLAEKWKVSFATLSRMETGKQLVPERILPDVTAATGKTAKELRPDLVERAEQISEILDGAQ